jgi:hypothetical protein
MINATEQPIWRTGLDSSTELYPTHNGRYVGSSVGGDGGEEDGYDSASGACPGKDRLARAGSGQAGREACGERRVQGAGQGK